MPTSITTGILVGKEVPEEIRGIDDYILFFGRIRKI